MSIPIAMLSKMRINIRQKLALAAIFSLAAVTMIFAIVRVVTLDSLTVQPEESWMYMWSGVENTVGMPQSLFFPSRPGTTNSPMPPSQSHHNCLPGILSLDIHTPGAKIAHSQPIIRIPSKEPAATQGRRHQPPHVSGIWSFLSPWADYYHRQSSLQGQFQLRRNHSFAKAHYCPRRQLGQHRLG